MTTAVEIPLVAATAQTFFITLGPSSFQLTLRFNQFAAVWTLDIAYEDGTPLVGGLPLVTGCDLLSQHKHLGIPGKLVVQTDHDTYATPTYLNLGVAGRLYYVED